MLHRPSSPAPEREFRPRSFWEMPMFTSRKLKKWQRQDERRGRLCKQCLHMFSTLGSLRALTSPRGARFDSTRFLRHGLRMTCPLCIIIRDIHADDDGLEQWPLWGGRSRNLRLKARTYNAPTSPAQKYPKEMLSILYVALSGIADSVPFNIAYRMSGGLMGDKMDKSPRPVNKPFLAMFRPPDLPSTSPLRCFPQGFDLTHDMYIEQAKIKLVDCLKNHERCGTDQPSLPTRVIDVRVGTNSNAPHLHRAQTGEEARYVALSYCWGGEQVTTMKANVDALSTALPEVSRSVADAITVTRKLGIQYLWVDALCIIQDDEDDKIRELSRMCDIYTNATLTICASNSSSAVTGFADCKVPDGVELPFRLPDGSLTSVVAVPCNFGSSKKYPLDSRAWTFQERLLSRRLLIFGYGELTWDCASSYTEVSDDFENFDSASGSFNSMQSIGSSDTSGYDNSDTESLSGTDLGDGEDQLERLGPQVLGDCGFCWHYPQGALFLHNLIPARIWADIVSEFTHRKHLVAEDRVNGIAGIIQRLEVSSSDTCIAGLWQSNFVEDLFWIKLGDLADSSDDSDSSDESDCSDWRTVSGRSDHSIDDVHGQLGAQDTTTGAEPKHYKAARSATWERRDVFIAPSWSWLSVSGLVCFKLGRTAFGYSRRFRTTAEVIECSVEPRYESLRHGPLKSGRVVLRTKILHEPPRSKIVRVNIDEDEMVDEAVIVYAKLGLANAINYAIWSDDPPFAGRCSPFERRRRDALNTIGLILVPNDDGCYRRIGTFQPSTDSNEKVDLALAWATAEEVDITIV